MPDTNPPVCVVTGANSGVGKATSELLAARGATVVMICRSRERGEKARAEIAAKHPDADLRLRLADLAELDEVRRLGGKLAEELDRVDALVNNAGVYRASREITVDGFERTQAVNHLAHFLLTRWLTDHLRAAAPGRVVCVASEAHRAARLRRAPLDTIIRGDAGYKGFGAYADSKALNVLFARELARRTDPSEIVATAVHPGTLATGIWSQNSNIPSLLARTLKPFMGRPIKGGRAVVRLALDAEPGAIDGTYFNVMTPSEPAAHATDTVLARQLWELSEKLTGAQTEMTG